MIVLGADMHKSSHTIAALDTATGQVLADKTIQVGARGFAALVLWARGLDRERMWALEDCRHVSGALERFLIGRGERVVRVSTRLMAGTRRSSRERGKSDQIDALSVARAALAAGIETLPTAALAGPELDLRLLVDHRERLVRTRVGLNSTCSGTSTICGRSCSCLAARCSQRSGRRRSPGGWPAPNNRCACASLATSCDTCVS
jgi:transposase